MERPPERRQRRSRWLPPPDLDLVSIPLVVGIVLSVFAILAAFVFIGWVGMIVLIVVLIAALLISFRVVTASETDD